MCGTRGRRPLEGGAFLAATLGVVDAILLESAVSYLGLGIRPPIRGWDNLLQRAQTFVWTQPLIAFCPG